MIVPIPKSCALWIIIIVVFIIAFPFSLILLFILAIFFIIKFVNDDKRNEFIQAINNKDEKKVRELLQQGVDVNKIYEDSVTALINASIYGCSGIVQLLLKHGAIVDMVDHNGNPAILHAVNYGHIAVVELLFKGGADPFFKHRNGATLIDLAVRKKRNDIFELILDYRSKKEQKQAK